MRPSEALERHREEIRAIVRRFGADNPRLFGSVARGEDTEESDIDILVDLPEGVSYYQVFKIEDAIKALVGYEVDIHTPGDPASRFSRRIAPELKPI